MVIGCYVGAIVLANWLITKYGQIAVPFVAFAIIPFDLVARDLMQDRWQAQVYSIKRVPLPIKMTLLIMLGGAISVITGTGSPRVNLASFIAFTAAGFIDALTYQWMIRYGRIFRINAATLTGAISDSVIFVTIAFSEVIWKLVGLQIGMKLAGGFVWSLLLYRFFRKPAPKPECRRIDLTEFQTRAGFTVCKHCQGSGSRVGYGDNLIPCVYCAGTGKANKFGDITLPWN